MSQWIRDWLGVGVILACVTSGVSMAGETKGRPNVLLIMTDDQGYGDLSIHGNKHLETPNIDRLGASGIRFDRFYVNSFCAPTRAALLTGRWPLRCGVHGVTHSKETMRSEEVTVAEALQSAGYRTACIGKWHNGEQYPFTPPGQGFDEFFGFHNGHWNNYFDAHLLRGTTVEKTSGYISDVLTGEAIRFMTNSQGAPFFCYVAYNAPHSPYQVPDSYYEKFRSKGFDEAVSAFWGMCENIDDNVGRLLQHLDDQQLAENTIVLFLTDNGGTAGVKIYNAGMRGGKTSVHEGGSRVPLFMRWNAAHWKPHLVKPITSHIDIYPTLLDLCDVPMPDGPPIDGVSLRPLLEAVDVEWPERILFTHNPINEINRFPGAVRTERFRLVRKIKGRSGGSSAVENDRGAQDWELYDMLADPGEKQNLARHEPEVVARLSQLYEEWIEDIRSDGLGRIPIPVGYEQENPVEIHAPQAYYDPPLHFYSGPGFANDWLTGWTDPAATVWFDLMVIQEGTYAVEIDYSCEPNDAGTEMVLVAAGSSLQFSVPAAPAVEVKLAHRDERGRQRYRNRNWQTLRVGEIQLPRGPVELELRVNSFSGKSVIDLKQVRLHLQIR